jgi:hypothetical protein
LHDLGNVTIHCQLARITIDYPGMTDLKITVQVSFPAPGQSALPLSPVVLVELFVGIPPSLIPSSIITKSPGFIAVAIRSKRPSRVKERADRPAYAELLMKALPPKEYFRYCPHPSVPLWPPSGAVVESPATQIVGIVLRLEDVGEETWGCSGSAEATARGKRRLGSDRRCIV